ncbi:MULTISPECIES: hypothetical protein [unclassified Nocardia]|uniref:hypothetical protein n=1 Tax=unclassified Nocardia TaxID=2637762 RepID=UPI0033AFB26A
MTDLIIDFGCLTGFQLDLEDAGTSLASNTARLLPAVALPTGASGIIATLAPAFEKFRSAISAAQQTDLTAISTLRTNLATAAAEFESTDDATAADLSKIAPGDSNTATGTDTTVKRFGGLQLPTLLDTPEEVYTVRAVVVSAIEQLSGYDEALSAAIGMKPAADYLAPLEADWEALQAISRRIGSLSINDYVVSQNLSEGTRWLQNSWQGDAAGAFGSSASTLSQTATGRSDDLNAVSKIVENGGICLERLVYNQAMALTSGIMQSMSFLGFNLPLGHWAQLIDSPLQESIKQEISSAVDTLRKSADARRDAIATLVGYLSTAADYTPGRTIPAINVNEFEAPEKVVVDLGVARFGFGDNVWWENSIETAP